MTVAAVVEAPSSSIAYERWELATDCNGNTQTYTDRLAVGPQTKSRSFFFFLSLRLIHIYHVRLCAVRVCRHRWVPVFLLNSNISVDAKTTNYTVQWRADALRIRMRNGIKMAISLITLCVYQRAPAIRSTRRHSTALSLLIANICHVSVASNHFSNISTYSPLLQPFAIQQHAKRKNIPQKKNRLRFNIRLIHIRSLRNHLSACAFAMKWTEPKQLQRVGPFLLSN